MRAVSLFSNGADFLLQGQSFNFNIKIYVHHGPYQRLLNQG